MSQNLLVRSWQCQGTPKNLLAGIREQVGLLGIASQWKDIFSAYTLATVKHETNGTFQPIKELMASVKKQPALYRQQQRYSPWSGKGFVQITWKRNYQVYENILSMPLVENPDLALKPNVALFILIHGMWNGAFTGRGFNDYQTPHIEDFEDMRRIVNGTDRAELIAGYARDYLEELF